MTLHKRVIASVLVCTVATAASGCTTMTTIKPASRPGAPLFGRVKAGDTVKVRTRDGQNVRFVVQKVDGDALVSRDGKRYTRDDIAQLQRREPFAAGTVIVTAGIGLLWLALAAAASSEPWLG